MSIQKLAKEAREYFILKERRDGGTFWTVKDGAPKWISDLCYRAHDDGELLPDDWRYRFVVEALDALSECDNHYDAQIEADTYTHELLAWVSSNLTRMQWVDKDVEDLGWEGMLAALRGGQLREKAHVLEIVLEELNRLIDAQE